MMTDDSFDISKAKLLGEVEAVEKKVLERKTRRYR